MDTDTLAGYLALAAEARARAGQATAGPWDQPDTAWCDLGEVWPATRQSTQEGMAIAYDITRPGDAVFIATARTDVPAMADAVESLVAEVQRQQAIIDQLAPRYTGIRQPDGTYRVHCSIPGCPRAAAKHLRDALALLNDPPEGAL